MKKTRLTLLSILFCAITFAQNVPQGINYQAIARDAAGAELANDSLTVQFSVLEGAAISWQETHTVTTNDFGMFTAIIGGGTSTSNGSSSTFDLVDWGAAAHSLKVEIDYGNGYLDMGTTDFMSVPYSLHAKTAANGSTTDELQTLSISGDTIFLVGGGLDSNFIVLPSESNNVVLDSLTLVEDDNFENYLENNGMGDGVMLNNFVLTSNIQNVINLDISGLGIMDFLGIENFISLQELRCQDNGLFDQMTGQLVGPATLYLPFASNLTYLNCSNNSTESLLIENCSDLQFLDCSNNNLIYLSLINKALLEELNCLQNNIYGTLDLSNSAGLTTLRANSNNLTSIDLSANILLTQLQIAANQISSIDLSQNTALSYLDIRWNELTTLDLSHNTALLTLRAGYAPYLTQIDLRNGNNINMPSSGFFTSNSPNLACISVDDTLWANNNTNWRNSSTYYGADDWTLFSADCNAIYGCTDSTANNYNAAANTDDGSCIINGCTDSTAFNYNPLANTDDGSCIGIGDTYQGGIIFWLNGNGGGLIAAPSDQSATPWGCYGTNLPGAVGTGIGSGVQNTIDIEAGCTTSGIAADICANYSDGTYSDWFLPSIDELDKMYVNLQQQGLSGFAHNYYWSSTEISSIDAMYLFFGNGNGYVGSKGNNGVVRPVRAFGNITLYGCTDSTAFNYNQLANTADSSCIAVVNGCTDPLYTEYDPLANTNDGSCATLIVNGCTDSTAINYNQLANTADSSCTYPCLLDEVVLTMTDSYGDTWNGGALTINGVTYDQPTVLYGGASDTYTLCVDLSTCIAVIYSAGSYSSENSWSISDASGTVLFSAGNVSGHFGVCIFGCIDSTAYSGYNPLANADDGSCIAVVNGCTDTLHTEYDPLANTDDGTCATLIVNGCTDSTAYSGYNPLANTDDGSCIAVVNGCTDATAFNYDSNANVDDGTCIPFLYGCTNSTACNYNASANVDDGSCTGLLGCMDTTACNYNPSATCDDGSCTGLLGCTNPNSFNYDPVHTCDDGSCIPFIYGCTDSTAFNYNQLANTADSSCIAVVNGCTDTLYTEHDPLANTNDGSCSTLIVNGCTDSTAFNYNQLANTADSSCIAVVNGCTDSTAANYYPFANTDDGSCCYVAGCMDATANNYDPAACFDDGSCLYYGCTYTAAFNYDPTANFDDGSCIYQPLLFNFTGSMQQITVPNGVNSVLVDAYGASGGDQNCCGSGVSGRGGRVQATLNVTAGEILYIYVGGEGNSTSGAVWGGWNGGGGATYNHGWSSSAGGGASDIRISGTSLHDRKIVAGGGGGFRQNKNGGHGGGLVGQSGNHYGGTGGTQTSGGAPYSGGSSHNYGTFGVGGEGNSNNYSCGSGGGGWYGGGAGPQFLLNGISWAGGTGGGGSSYTDSIQTVAGSVIHTQGIKIGHGEITITFQ